jgi:hypothetical protein
MVLDGPMTGQAFLAYAKGMARIGELGLCAATPGLNRWSASRAKILPAASDMLRYGSHW